MLNKKLTQTLSQISPLLVLFVLFARPFTFMKVIWDKQQQPKSIFFRFEQQSFFIARPIQAETCQKIVDRETYIERKERRKKRRTSCCRRRRCLCRRERLFSMRLWLAKANIRRKFQGYCRYIPLQTKHERKQNDKCCWHSCWRLNSSLIVV